MKTSTLQPLPAARLFTSAVALLLVFATVRAAPAAVVVVYSGLRDIAIPLTFDGVHLDLNTGTVVASSAEWEINPVFGGVAIANNNTFQPVRVANSNLDAILNLAQGTVVSSTLTYASGFGGSGNPGHEHVGTGLGQFLSGTDGYIGFRFTDAGGTHNGWMRVSLTNNTAGGLIRDWAYETGTTEAIVVGRVLQSAPQTFSLTPGAGEAFELVSPVANSAGANNVVKTGDGATTFTGTNTYTGTTTVTAGDLVLKSPSLNGAIPTDNDAGTDSDIVINGGDLIIGASEQIGNNGSVSLQSGSLSFSLMGLTETTGRFTNSGGTFLTGGNTFIGTGSTMTWSGGTNTINDGGLVQDSHFVITGGINTVQGGITGGVMDVQIGGIGTGLVFGGITSPTLTLDSAANVAGKLRLSNDLTVDNTLISGTASILNGGNAANPGQVDLMGGTRSFTVNNGSAATDLNISALVSNGSLTKTGAGTMELSRNNTYTGATTVNGGTLLASAAGSLGATSGITLNSGGTLLLGGAGNRLGDSASLTLGGGSLVMAGLSESVGALSLTTNSVIDMGAGNSVLTFSNLNPGSNWSGSLSILNWSGAPRVTGGTDQVLFNAGTSNLNSSQLAGINFYSGTGGSALGGGGAVFMGSELVPVPEPGPIAATAVLALLILRRESRRSRA